MDGHRFDRIVRKLGSRPTRRSVITSLVGASVAGALATGSSGAANTPNRCKSPRSNFCGGRCVNIHSNDKHCGKCGKRCKNNEFCRRGDCRDKQTGGCGQGDPCQVFVTSETFGAAFDGLDGADAFCQRAADRAELPGTYRAWLSNADGSPSTRFRRNPGPYVLIDEVTVVADDWDQLTSGTLQNAINLDEVGNTQIDTVFTNTTIAGSPTNPTGPCGNFENGGIDTVVNGLSGTTAAIWTRKTEPDSCTVTARLYCFQQS